MVAQSDVLELSQLPSYVDFLTELKTSVEMLIDCGTSHMLMCVHGIRQQAGALCAWKYLIGICSIDESKLYSTCTHALFNKVSHYEMRDVGGNDGKMFMGCHIPGYSFYSCAIKTAIK